MSHSRKKKTKTNQLSLFSFTEKLRESSGIEPKKQRKEKESVSQNRLSWKIKQTSKSCKKENKKKFLETEVEKLIKKRYVESDAKMRQLKEKNTNDISGLKEDLESMKDVISKLAVGKGGNQIQEKKRSNDSELQTICLGYRRKIGEMHEELQVQKKANAKLEEAHIQSQVFAQQTKDFSESIKHQLLELTQKHFRCEQNLRDLEQARRTIRIMKGKEQQSEEITRRYKQNQQKLRYELQMTNLNLQNQKSENNQLQLNLQSSTIDINKFQEQIRRLKTESSLKNNSISKLQQQLGRTQEQYQELLYKCEQIETNFSQKCQKWQQNIVELQNACEQLEEQKQIISESFLQKIEAIHSELKIIQTQKVNLMEQNQMLFDEITSLKQQVAQLSHNTTFRPSQIKANQHFESETIVDGEGLALMERKCEELYEQIKKQKLKWNLHQSIDERKNFASSVVIVTAERDERELELKSLQMSQTQSKRTIQQLKSEVKMLSDSQECFSWLQKQKDSLVKSNKEYQNRINQQEKQLIQRDNKIGNLQKQLEKADHSVLKNVNLLKIAQKQVENQKNALKQLQRLHYQQTSKLEEGETEIKEFRKKYVKISGQNNSLTSQISQKISQFKLQSQKFDQQVKLWKQKYLCKQSERQLEEKLYKDCQKQLKHQQSLGHQLSLQVSKLTQSTKRSQDHLEWYQKEINLKNKAIVQLKETVKLVKEQSMRIRQEVENYQMESMDGAKKESYGKEEGSQQLTAITLMAQKQLQYMKQSLNYLQSDKADLEAQLKSLKRTNEELAEKLGSINIQVDGLIRLRDHDQMIKQMREQLASQKIKHQQRIVQYQTKINQIQLKSEIRQQIISKQKSENESQKLIFSQKMIYFSEELASYKEKVKFEAESTQKLTKIIAQKEQLIQSLANKDTSSQEKRAKIVNEIQNIQNKIAKLAERNTKLEEENTIQAIKLSESEKKVKILLQTEIALQEQIHALQDQAKMLKLEITQAREGKNAEGIKRQIQMNETYTSLQTTSSLEICSLKETIKQLANELSVNINKFNAKNEEIQHLKHKYRQMQSILKENHQLLSQERSQRQKLSALNTQINCFIEKYKLQITSKDKEIDILTKEKSFLKSKLTQIESKYQLLRGKFDSIEHQKQQARKEIQNQSLTLRVLREENKNIEKVMCDQLNQRKVIIEQLVNQKRMLYTHLQRQ